MVTCRSISEAVWQQAREALVFYFRHRVDFERAEDLAQETLATFWRRGDFEFEREQDFPKICFAFAGRILKAARRKDRNFTTAELIDAAPPSEQNSFGLNPVEMGVYLDEVMDAARSGMLEREWRAIENRARFEFFGDSAPVDAKEGNRRRVEFHRAKEKLAGLLRRKKKR